MDEHISGCQKCTAVLKGTRNIVQLYGDERMMEAPQGYSQRLHERLEEDMPTNRRSFVGWMVAAAAAVLFAGSYEVARSIQSRRNDIRSKLSQPGKRVPPDLQVVVSDEGKLFHLAQCTYIHDGSHLRTLTAHEAQQQGYTPCPRCLKQYLDQSAVS